MGFENAFSSIAYKIFLIKYPFEKRFMAVMRTVVDDFMTMDSDHFYILGPASVTENFLPHHAGCRAAHLCSLAHTITPPCNKSNK